MTIPRGALSGPLWVQVGHQVSSSTQLVILAQSGFSHLSGVAFQPIAREIWLTDRGLGSSYPTRAVRLAFGGTAWGKNEYDNPGIGTWKYQGGQGFDSNQSWFYGLANSTTNGGTRKIMTGSPYTASAFTQVKPGSNDSVQVLGVATSPALTNTAFFAYNDVTTGEKHIRKIDGTTVLDTDYGNFGVTNLPFASLSGLVLDQSGNLFDTETTLVRKITPAETSTVVATGFTTAMGVAHDQVNATDAGALLVTDSGAGSLVLVDLSSSPATKATIVSGLNLPRAGSFAVTPLHTSTCGGLPNTDLSFVLAGEDTQVRQVADPRISLTPSGPTRVWISKMRADDSYPSPYQGADHQITITATITPTPTTQRTICFRVIDPPDTAPYSDGSTTGYWCDNKDPGTTGAGTFAQSGTSVYCATTDEDGHVSATLNTTYRYSGDNYIVQASFDAWSPSNATKALAETGVITAWKRVYIEKDKMFRRGGVLYASGTGDMLIPSGSTSLRICKGPDSEQMDNISSGDKIALFDVQRPFEIAHDEAYAGTIDRTSSPDYAVVPLVEADLSTTYATLNSYIASPLDAASHYPDFSQGQCASLGVPLSGNYEADLGSMWHTFNDAFVEFWVPPDGAGAMPYLPKSWFDWSIGTPTPGGVPLATFSQIWFSHFQAGAGTPPIDQAHNYFHLMGANDANNFSGITWAPYDFAFIMVQQLENLNKTAQETISMNKDTTMHEFGHQFIVNACSDPAHDNREAWCANVPANNCGLGGATAELCVMTATPEGNTDSMDGVSRFCLEDLLTGDPNCATPPVPRDGAIRTDSDPQ